MSINLSAVIQKVLSEFSFIGNFVQIIKTPDVLLVLVIIMPHKSMDVKCGELTFLTLENVFLNNDNSFPLL